MRDLSFAIPIRVDTPDRLENCDAVLRFLTKHFPKSEIQLIEQDVTTRTAALRSAFPDVVWHFEFNEKYFRKVDALNMGLLRSTRRCVCAYDTDVLIHPTALRTAAALIAAGRWPIVIPFNLIFVEISGRRRKALIDSLDISELSNITHLSAVPRHAEITSRVLNGGIMMCDRELVIREGGYNRKMTSYGWEDTEFFKRFAKLGYYSYILQNFNLIHLDHRRGCDSWINEMYDINQAEFNKVMSMSKPELRDYVERELFIAPPADPIDRRRQRRRRALANLVKLRWAAHIANKASTIWRINGTREVARRIFGTPAHA